MLLQLEIENYGSFRNRAFLDLTLPAFADTPHSLTLTGQSVANVAMVYGHNASGKTTLLDALMTLQTAVRDSHRAWEPTGKTTAKPFLLRPDAAGQPTTWRVLFTTTNDGDPYEYSVTMDERRVLSEELRRQSVETRRFSRVFLRDADGVISRKRGIRNLHTRLRPNALLLSLAVQESNPDVLSAYEWLASPINGLNKVGDRRTHAHVLDALITSTDLPDVARLARAADLGILDVEGERYTSEQLDELKTMAGKLREIVPGIELGMPTGEYSALQYSHAGEDGVAYELPPGAESGGTYAYLSVGLVVERALDSGGLVVIDELDGSLHPALVEQLVELFRSPERNQNGAQLLASTHDTHLFGRSARSPLTKYEVWFTEKDLTGASELFSLADFSRVRDGIDQERHYLAGRYGAVPNMWLAAAGAAR